MRRRDREIKDTAQLESILTQAQICRIAVAEGDSPYVFPVCFGYQDNCLYFHSAREGKKIDILRRNSKVCFEVDVVHELLPGDKACEWSMEYSSVIGFGRAFFIDDKQERRQALQIMMDHYSQGEHSFSETALEEVAVIKVEIDSLSGKTNRTV